MLILPDANTAGMQVFLDAFAATIAQDEHVALVVDGAGWHGSKTLNVPSNITLVALPPYCPELNPVERVWLYLKERFLSLRLHNDYNDIVAAASKAWKRLCRDRPLDLTRGCQHGYWAGPQCRSVTPSCHVSWLRVAHIHPEHFCRVSLRTSLCKYSRVTARLKILEWRLRLLRRIPALCREERFETPNALAVSLWDRCRL